MNTPLLVKTEGRTTILTLNRPEKRNALTIELMKLLCGEITRASRDGQRILILRGAGGFFCAGLDLKEASEPRTINLSAKMVARSLLALSQTRLVTIAVVEGGALAGGAGLMSSCDFVVAEKSAVISFPEVRRGLVAALVITLLRRQLPERSIRELLLSAEPITSQRAMEIGLVSRVTRTSELMSEAKRISTQVCKGGPAAIAETKKNLAGSWPTSLKQDLNRALKQHLKTRHSKEATEGISAFLEKRPPKWMA